MDPFSDLEQKIEKIQSEVKRYKARKNTISFLRLAGFIGAVLVFYWYLGDKYWGLLALAILLFVCFLALIFVSVHFQERIDFANAKLDVIADIKTDYRLRPDFENIKEDHPFSRDLDVLGKVSLFSKLNKTQSLLGAKRLREFLLAPLLDADSILKRQDSIREFSTKTEWNITLLAHIRRMDLTDDKALLNTDDFKKKGISKTMGILLNLFPILYLILIVISIVKSSYGLGTLTLVLMIAVSYIVAQKYDEQISGAFEAAELKVNQFSGLVKVFQLIEQEDFTAEQNLSLKQNFLKPSASESLKKLARQVKNLENGYTSYFGFVLNLFSLWNLRYALKVEKLLNEYKPRIPVWIDSFSKIETLISLGIYAYKNPGFQFPEVSGDSGKLMVEDLNHPLLAKEISVANSFQISNGEEVAIITGANMTGKSTFLRTIGANLVLAMNGLPINAKTFSFQPMKLFTSMRTSDSLSDGSSYFQAEILRLKDIKTDLENGIPLFIILDEILKGTNSTDKLTGSKKFLEKIITLKTPFSCLIATHDLELTNLATENPDHVANYCFELETRETELIADYKMKPGAATKMNALFLMKKYGIIA